ncbi:Nuclear factor of activated T-cells, cytoplasmic 1 [Acipenser ruthenus]|uniref:Nuclear factor of activated T-cells, cytoplasmic 1 n=1 Tax=Acipenser ruthenus TaxID=7906 RepID=A0A662YWT3_ACIRT|nr:Nuclear factor of activated T-cells, cytoplasmic 1 [Acipenser ruthenus]
MGVVKDGQFHHQSYIIESVIITLRKVPIIKTEPTDDYESIASGLSTLSKSYYNQQVLTSMMPPDPGSCLVASFPSYQQRNIVMSSSSPTSNSSPKLHDLSPSTYTKCNANTGHSQLASLQQPTAGVPTIQEVPNRSVVVHPNSPDQSSLIMLQSQVSQHLSSNCSHGYQQTLYPNSPSSSLVPSAAQEPLYVQTYSPPHPSVPMGQQPLQLKKAQQNGSPTNQSGSLPLVQEENSQTSLPVIVKQEPQELDQMYLDDGKWKTT